MKRYKYTDVLMKSNFVLPLVILLLLKYLNSFNVKSNNYKDNIGHDD